MTPTITQISNEIRMARNGTPFAQQIATMSDGSMWEVPCVGNGSMWRKVGKSHAELQADFSAYYLAIMENTQHNVANGINLNSNQGTQA